MAKPAPAPGSDPGLKRNLRLWDLILYGVIVIQPTAPLPIFGLLSAKSHGHAVTTILLAMVAMLLTAISYGRMARIYPSAGSAFTYVGKEVGPASGFVTGWSMALDYLLNPMISIIWASQAAMNFVPQIPYWVWAVFFFLLFTGLNLRGIKASARINEALAIAMGVVIAIFLVAAARWVLGHPHGNAGFFTAPFYDPRTFRPGSILGGTSLAVLTYIGFDGISTLSEEVERPERNVPLATVLVCLVIGALSAIEVYAAQLVWPVGLAFPDLDTAFVHVAGSVGGSGLFFAMNATLLVASVGAGMASQVGAARLLYGMGRSNALPRSFFGTVDAKNRIPRNNVIFVGTLALAGAFCFSYSLGAEMLNFGALIAFMGVNVAALLHDYARTAEKKLRYLLPPACGGLICLLLWLSLSHAAMIAGGIWTIAGVSYGAWRTGGFRTQLINFDVP